MKQKHIPKPSNIFACVDWMDKEYVDNYILLYTHSGVL